MLLSYWDCQLYPSMVDLFIVCRFFLSYLFTYTFLCPSLVVHKVHRKSPPKKSISLENPIEHIPTAKSSQPKPHHRPTSTPNPSPQTRHIPNTRPPSQSAGAPPSHLRQRHRETRARAVHSPASPALCSGTSGSSSYASPRYQTPSRHRDCPAATRRVTRGGVFRAPGWRGQDETRSGSCSGAQG